MEGGKPILVRCPWYVQVRGVDPNTGEETGPWGCAIAWMPTLMINAANESRRSAAATESFRNEMARQGAKTQQVLLVAAQLANRGPITNSLEQIEICE
ncbi:MAG: hypothetical protein H0X43_02800 [Nitrosospira sp.]|nr:hypothetical protein [Nitrosospira sp.]